MTKYLVAIVAHRVGDELRFAKYRHNLKDTQHYKLKFSRDMHRKFEVLHINWYDKQSGAFIERWCSRSCGPSDHYKEGKCGSNGCVE